MSLNRIYDNGYLAGEAGVNPCMNPHLPGTKEHDAWANGFDDAVRELEAARYRSGRGDDILLFVLFMVFLAFLCVLGAGFYAVVSWLWSLLW